MARGRVGRTVSVLNFDLEVEDLSWGHHLAVDSCVVVVDEI